MDYPEDALIRMKEYDAGNKEAAEWLLQNNYKELVATVDCIRGSDAAEEWLQNNKHTMLFAFTRAIWDDEGALVFLLRFKFTDWAAMANIVNHDQSAVDVFIRLRKKVKLELAMQLRSTKSHIQNKGSLLFGALNIYK